MSSSSAGQWMPCPPAISRHEVRSSAVAWARRGYQASGAAIVRPSVSSTDRVSSLTATPVARAVRPSTAEEFMPALHQMLSVLLDQSPNAVDLLPAEAVTSFQPHGVKPEFR